MNKLILFSLLKIILSYEIPFIKNIKNIRNVKLPLIRNVNLPLIKKIILPLIENEKSVVVAENEKPVMVVEDEKKPFIKDVNLPVCVNCLHFIEHKTNYPYDPLPDNKSFGRCKKFGYKDIITGEFNYDFAYLCRNNEKKCGLSGKEFEPKISIEPPFQEIVTSIETPNIYN